MAKARQEVVQLQSGRFAGKWMVKVKLEELTASGHHKEKRVLCDTQREALEEKRKIEREIARGTFSTERTLLSSYISDWLEQKKSEVKQRTVEAYAQAFRVHLDLKLAHRAAEDGHFRNARHAEQTRLHQRVGKSAQLHERAPLGCDAEGVHHAGGGSQRREHGQTQARRQAAADGGEAFAHHLPRLKHIGRVLKHDGDDGQPLNGLGTQGLQLRDAVDGGFDGTSDELLHLLRREARSLGLDDDLRWQKIRKHIQLCPRGDIQPVGKQRTRQRDDDAATAQREANNGIKHGGRLLLRLLTHADL